MIKYVVAVSGGVDSMYLAHMLAQKNQAAAFVHINHHTRGEANILEQELVKKTGATYNVPVHVYDYYHQGGNFQQEARNFRYEKLCMIANDYGGKIAIAHHLDDQLENCLVSNHLVKSNIMSYRSSYLDCYVYRPLLALRKNKIYELANSQGIKFYEDISNTSLNYSRNVNRHKLLDSKIRNYAKKMYIVESLKKQFICKSVTALNRKYLISKSTQYRYNAIYNLIKQYDQSISVKNKQLMAINEVIEKQKNCKYKVANCVELFIEYDKIYMSASIQEFTTSSNLKVGKNIFNGIEFYSSTSSGTIRTWISGDKVKIKNGHKKVSRLFIDNKIEPSMRKKWPIVISSSGDIVNIPNIWRKNEVN